MALYEHVVISRQDISPQQAEALNDTLKHLIEEGGAAGGGRTPGDDGSAHGGREFPGPFRLRMRPPSVEERGR